MEIDNEISILCNELSSLPDEELICAKNGTRFKWYLRNNKQSIYLPKANINTAKALARKKYIKARIEDLNEEKKLLQTYLRSIDKLNAHTNKVLSNTGIKQLLANQFTSFPEEIASWLSEEYQTNPNHPENLIHSSISGNKLRSKSEAQIDMLLFQNNIPFRYEAALMLNGYLIYPDFTIKHPKTGKIYYWEHFGLMDDEMYRKKYIRKLDTYTANGIIPSINLITSYETKENPFSLVDAEHIIQQYFL